MNTNKLSAYFAVPFVLFLLAVLIYYLGVFNRLAFPNPFLVAKEFVYLFTDIDFFNDVLITCYRIISASIIAVVLGVPAGLVLGYNQTVYNLFEFIIDFAKSIPVTALFPLFMLFFGIGDAAKIFCAVYISVFVIIINTSYGVKHFSKKYVTLATVYGISKSYLFKHILFIGAAPSIIAGIRISISYSVIVIIVTEMFIGSVNGLGHSILYSHLIYEIPKMYALIFFAGLFGYSLNKILLILEKRFIHWTT